MGMVSLRGKVGPQALGMGGGVQLYRAQCGL